MSASQRRKGAQWERDVANMLKLAGLDARRGIGQTRSGGEVADVELDGWWIECKVGKSHTPDAALAQALAAMGDRYMIPVAICKKDRKPATATMYLEDWIILLTRMRKESDRNGQEIREGQNA